MLIFDDDEDLVIHCICPHSIGSTVRHQYPSAVPNYKADWFAENMLPEGAHNREVDCTYMLLNREGTQIDEVGNQPWSSVCQALPCACLYLSVLYMSVLPLFNSF